ncbi:MAG: hypothetical protein JST65_14585 [Acidobacteria bacterium]|nr:hypothetical protein [Acidobacteriota bacterium]
MARSIWVLGGLAVVCLASGWWIERRLANGRMAAIILVVGLKSVGWLSAVSAALILLASRL